MQKAKKRPAIFLDRDGTINVEKDYLYKVEDLEFIPGAPEAIRKLKSAGYLIIVVTNQSGVGRGYYELDDVATLHARIQEKLKSDHAAIDGFYVCPHHPEKAHGEFLKVCDCRKGAPGMLLQAAAEHNIDLQQSYMVGDKIADVEAAENAGCRPVLVLTGYGRQYAVKLEKGRALVCDDLLAAAKAILGNREC